VVLDLNGMLDVHRRAVTRLWERPPRREEDVMLGGLEKHRAGDEARFRA
jgi:hypothetical protein